MKRGHRSWATRLGKVPMLYSKLGLSRTCRSRNKLSAFRETTACLINFWVSQQESEPKGGDKGAGEHSYQQIAKKATDPGENKSRAAKYNY